MSFTCSTHLFGSISGYATLAKSVDISEIENEALSGLGFGQSSDSGFIDSLETNPCAYGRALPSGRYAVTRCFAGAPDDVGRSTLLLASVVMTGHDWLNEVRGNLKAFLLDSNVWNLAKFHAGESIQSKSFDGQIQSNENDYYLADYLVKINQESQDTVVVLPGGQQSVDAILHIAGALSPEDSLEFRWGIRMLSTTVPVDMMTFVGEPSSGGRRTIVRCDIKHDFFYEAIKFFVNQRNSFPAIPNLETLASGTFVQNLGKETKESKKSKQMLIFVCAALLIVVLAIIAFMFLAPSGTKKSTDDPAINVPAKPTETDESIPQAILPVDNCPDDPNKTEPGECGCGTPETGDRDGDGVHDCNDNCPDDPDKTEPGLCGCGKADIDTDGDGVLDCNDNCPDDPDKTEPGLCGCGVPDKDSDGDGTPDCVDACPDDPNKTEPGECGCGTPETGDRDGDGVHDCNDNCPDDPDKTEPGLCGCGKADIDTDGDGVLNCNDNCPDDPDKTEPGECGCGTPETGDVNGDGVPDCNDNCPDDPDKTEPGLCGCGTPETDTDGNGIPDCIDPDADPDGDFILNKDDDANDVTYKSKNSLCKDVLGIVEKDKKNKLPNYQELLEKLKQTISSYRKSLENKSGIRVAKESFDRANEKFKKYLEESNDLENKLRSKFVKYYSKFEKEHTKLDVIQFIALLEAIQSKYSDENGVDAYLNRLKKFRNEIVEGKGKDYKRAMSLIDTWFNALNKEDGVVDRKVEKRWLWSVQYNEIKDTTLNNFLRQKIKQLKKLL